MLSFLTLPQNLPFAAALALMGGVLALQLVGLDAGGGEADAAGGGEADAAGGGALAWLGVGRVPLLVALVILLGLFGVLGLKLQGLSQLVQGAPLSAWIAAPAALVAALPMTRMAAGVIGRLFPSIETDALPRDALLGRRAVIAIGRAASGSPAQARVRDLLGATHHVMVEPEHPDASFAAGAEVLLTRRDGETFRAVPVEPHPFLLPQGAR